MRSRANDDARPASAGPPAPTDAGPTGASAAVVVFAVGNRSRGDDALGPLLAERLAAWLAANGCAANVDVVEDFQLQIEHALDLGDHRLALFVDAGTGTPAPFELRAVAPSAPGRGHTTHALAPEAVLGVYRQVTGAEPPPAFVLCVRGERFELGTEPGEAARRNLEAAWPVLVRLCERPDPASWRGLAAHAAAGRSPEAARRRQCSSA